MSKKNNYPKSISITTDGKKVIDGVFRLFDTSGLPLDVIFIQCKENNMMPSWIHFYEDAIKAGWSEKTILNRLETNISDVYGYEFSCEVIKRLEYYISKKK